MNAFQFVSLAVALSTTACGSLTPHRIVTGEPQRAIEPSRVQFIIAEAPLPVGFAEIGIIEVTGRGNRSELEDVIDGLRIEAGKLGCTHVVRVRIDRGVSTATGTGVCGVVR